jgi:hypothetical protein
MMEAVSTSEKSVNFYQTTQCSTPEDKHLHIHCLENIKSLTVHLSQLLGFVHGPAFWTEHNVSKLDLFLPLDRRVGSICSDESVIKS